jgi:hypothetical protein
VIDQLASKVIENKTGADINLHKLDQRVDKLENGVRQVKDALNENDSVVQSRQRESSELVNQQVKREKSLTDSRIEMLSSEIVALKIKVSEWDSFTRSADSTGIRESRNTVQLSPSAVSVGTSDNNGGTDRAITSCPCQSGTCNVCVRCSMNADHVNVPVRYSSVNSCLSNSEFPLPLFDENSEVNPVFHLKQTNL